ncbi:MAG: hypothetical protein SF182_27100 [Deltaproteobacteria bacterium]|nr:hypothetical protein [Deltaproteobacteria bacterium]
MPVAIRLVATVSIALLSGCSGGAPASRPTKLAPCPGVQEGLRVVVAQQITNPTGHDTLFPCTIENRMSQPVDRIRYVVGFFDDQPLSLDKIRRVEQQADVQLKPGESKQISLSSGGGAFYLPGEKPVCAGVRAVPFDLGGKPVPFAEAWAPYTAP